ncbi:polysaccharide biosynthesis protein [Celeribacter sp. ASW11-22]|nr:polysaccharide biosynthesis protein [Celeribacter litoreus]
MGIGVGVFAFAGLTGSRALAVKVLSGTRHQLCKRRKVAIFGAGTAGVRAASTLSRTTSAQVAGFFDDNRSLQGMEIGGVPVWSPEAMVSKIRKHHIETLVIALPDAAQSRRARVRDLCETAGVKVEFLPNSIDLLVSGAGPRLRGVDARDLLDRQNVDLNLPEVGANYTGRVIMVTGAGGSIGSELCQQLLNFRPAKIVLFDMSEFNLYSIDMALKRRAEEFGVDIEPYLGTITDRARLQHVIRSQRVEIILHAAAYKHVPMVEGNVVEGVRNNIFGTKRLAEVAVETGVSQFVLVSSDKAVRPKGLMGATKRISELILQDMQTRNDRTKFSMVRFGNVLGSSGSMLPLFVSQIDAGGPVTVTHPDASRYFMTVQEASRLVLLAGAFAEGGDVFVLDMGEPQSILAIAKKLIQLSGLAVRDPISGEGDVEIAFIGLRPGEKLHEELFWDPDNLFSTHHPKIFRAQEACLSQFEVAGLLRELQHAIDASDEDRVRSVALGYARGCSQTRRLGISHDVPVREKRCL